MKLQDIDERLYVGIKAAPIKEQLENATKIMDKYGLNALELHAIKDAFNITSENRVKLINESLRLENTELKRISYHMPLPDSIDDLKKEDLIKGTSSLIYAHLQWMVEDLDRLYNSIKSLDPSKPVPLVVHFFGTMDNGEKNYKPMMVGYRQYLREKSKKAYKDIIEGIEDIVSRLSSDLNIVVSRENNPPNQYVLDYYPPYDMKDMLYIKGSGFCFDVSHYQMMKEFSKAPYQDSFYMGAILALTEFFNEGVLELGKELPDYRDVIDFYGDKLQVAHISDAYSFDKEGLPIEYVKDDPFYKYGDVDFHKLVKYLLKSPNSDLMHIIEIKNGHNAWDVVDKSVANYLSYLKDVISSYGSK